jgi:hypothetical protein
VLQQFLNQLLHALKNLLPIVLVVVFFQLVIFQSLPSEPVSIAVGLLIVAIGIALFLLGLELSIFPVGKNLANQFARKGSLPLLMFFGFAIGFAAVIAEPALIAVAEKAEQISDGRVNGLTLRLIVALSVGAVMVLGVLRIILGWPIHWLMIGGYIIVLLVTFFAPAEIVGLAYDSGGVTTNIVTVPLVAALGLGLASSIKGRKPLTDGFGLVALAVMVPMISVQLYGIWVYNFSSATVIAPDDLEEQAIAQAKQAGATGITILSGRGIGGENRKTFFGMTFEGSQSVLLMVVAKHLSLPILKKMRSLLLDQGNSRGIAFTVSIDHLTGLDMGQVMKFEQHLREQND